MREQKPNSSNQFFENNEGFGFFLLKSVSRSGRIFALNFCPVSLTAERYLGKIQTGVRLSHWAQI